MEILTHNMLKLVCKTHPWLLKTGLIAPIWPQGQSATLLFKRISVALNTIFLYNLNHLWMNAFYLWAGLQSVQWDMPKHPKQQLRSLPHHHPKAFPCHQGADAASWISPSQTPIGPQVWHHRDFTYAARSHADDLWETHWEKTLLFLCRRGRLIFSIWSQMHYND